MSVRYRLGVGRITQVAQNQWGNRQGDPDATILPIEPDPPGSGLGGWCNTPAASQIGSVTVAQNLLLTTLAAAVIAVSFGNTVTASAPAKSWQPANTSQSSPLALLTSVSTTVLRTPTYQQAKQAPAVNVVQFPNLLTSTLSAAIPPFIPAAQPALSRSIQVLLDTSKGTPKTLYADAQLPIQNVQIAAPGAVRLVVDTSQKQPITLQVIAPPPPFFNPPYSSPIRVLWQPLDGSRGTPKTLTADAQLPFQNPAMSVLGRFWTLADTSQSTQRTLDVLSAPVGQAAFVKLPAAAWQPLDTSRGTPKTLIADAQLPVQNIQIAAPSPVRLVVDTSQKQPITLQVIVPPPPFAILAQSSTPRTTWQPADTSRGMPKTLTADNQLPFSNTYLTVPTRIWGIVNTSQGTPVELFPIVVPGGAEYSFTFIGV